MRLTHWTTILLLFLFAVSAGAATDISGRWSGRMHMGGGGAESPVDVTFTFSVDGTKVSGSVSSSRGEFKFQDGKLDGDSLKFTLEVTDARIHFDGLLTEEGIDFLADFEGRGRTDQFTAKKISD